MGQDHYSRRKRHAADPRPELAELLQSLWPPEELDWTVFGHGRRAMEAIFNEPPDLLVVDNRLADIGSGEVASIVKSENVYRQLPVVLCLDSGDLERDWDWAQIEADDFLLRPFSPREAKERIRLTFAGVPRHGRQPPHQAAGEHEHHQPHPGTHRPKDGLPWPIAIGPFQVLNDSRVFAR